MVGGVDLCSSDAALLLCFHPVNEHGRLEHALPATQLLAETLDALPPGRPVRLWAENGDFAGLPRTVQEVEQALALRGYRTPDLEQMMGLIAVNPFVHGAELFPFFDRLAPEAERLIENEPESACAQSHSTVHRAVATAAAAERSRRPVSVAFEMPERVCWTLMISSRLCGWHATRKLASGEYQFALKAHGLSIERLIEASWRRDQLLAARIRSRHAGEEVEVVVRGGFHYHFFPQLMVVAGFRAHWRCEIELEPELDPLWQYYLRKAAGTPIDDELILRCFVRGTVVNDAVKDPRVLQKLHRCSDDRLRSWMQQMTIWLNEAGTNARRVQERSLAWVLATP